MAKRHLFLFFFLVLTHINLRGQVLPPVLDCAFNDTLFYTPVANSCGAFVSYNVYFSPSFDGPYALLGTVSDPANLSFPHPNSANQVFYYYVEPVFDCPGEAVILSDTISNRPPELGILHTVSVENNAIRLSWETSPSAEVTSYSIYLFSTTGLEYITDTPDNFYIDILRDPNIESLAYLIVANDICGNASIFGDPISNIFLTSIDNFCEQTITFNWNAHQNTEQQELWLRTINGDEILVETLDASSEEFTLTSVPQSNITGFFIRANIAGGQNRVADSNIVPFQDQILVMMDEIYFSSISGRNEDQLEVQWCWNQDADLAEYSVEFSSVLGMNQEDIAVSNSLSPNEIAVLSPASTSDATYDILIETTDICGNTFATSNISSILLEAVLLSDSEVALRWNTFRYDDALLDNYQLYEIINGNTELVYEGLSNQTNVIRDEAAGEVCYYIVTNAKVDLMNGTEKNTQVISNEVCSEGLPIIRMPNAFNPYGVNSIFRPLVGKENLIAAYEMSIFSRYGELLYQTDDWNQGWNGRTGLREMPQGIYTYLVEVDVSGGETIQIKGYVMLVR